MWGISPVVDGGGIVVAKRSSLRLWLKSRVSGQEVGLPPVLSSTLWWSLPIQKHCYNGHSVEKLFEGSIDGELLEMVMLVYLFLKCYQCLYFTLTRFIQLQK